MASPIVTCQKALLKANQTIEKMNSDAERHVLKNLSELQHKDAEIKFLRVVIARKELQKSMITSMFDKVIGTAGSVGEARMWWKKLQASANGIAPDAEDWDDQAMRVTQEAGIAWSKESIDQNMRELLEEYGVTHVDNGIVYGRNAA
jgi:hypothetical protein